MALNGSSNEGAGGTGSTNDIKAGGLAYRLTLGPDIQWMAWDGAQPTQFKEYQQQSQANEPPIVANESSKWSLGLGFAPDLSLVGFSEVTSPGTNFAMTVDYQLGGGWSIQTGAIYAKKIYTADGEDYKPPSGFWTYGVVPDYVDATCNVIDIPLNVRYSFKQKRNHRFYVSTGLSTYFMLREDYEYDYEPYNPALPSEWHAKNESQHFLGIYNLSLGYQRAISPNFSLEIEPFIKAPLTGIGFFNVNLWSTGTLFSIRYHLPR